jgi:hypothetical protein
MAWRWLMFLMVFLAAGSAGVDVEAKPVSDEVPRISKEDLKAMLGSPDLIILDVDNGNSWSGGNIKIAGALRGDPGEFSKWYDEYPRDKTLVLYCS